MDRNLQELARKLTKELSAGIREGRTAEELEELIGRALQHAAAQEREHCADIAEHRAAMWASSSRWLGSTELTAPKIEAREREKEALAIADALRAEEVQTETVQ